MKIINGFAVALFLWVLCAGGPTLAEDTPTVFVSILPQKYFVQQISGDLVKVEVMVPPGASPHTYEPKPSQMRKLADARAFFTIGIALEEAWLDRITKINPNLTVVHTEAGIDRMAMSVDHVHEDDEEGHGEGDHGEEHGEDGEHGDHHGEEGEAGHEDDEDGLDPHIWLSPALVKQQAEVIRASLESMDPANAPIYQANSQSFINRINALDSQLKEILDGKQGMKFMVFHPSWGYFARSYDLVQVAVEIEGKSPKPAHLKELIELARREQIKVIFAQPQMSKKSAEVIAGEIGAEVVLIDPLGENWFENMTAVAEKLGTALR